MTKLSSIGQSLHLNAIDELNIHSHYVPVIRITNRGNARKLTADATQATNLLSYEVQ